MRPIRYVKCDTTRQAVHAVESTPGAIFFAGGTTLIDLMKLDVMTPQTLVDIRKLPFLDIQMDEKGVHIGANVSNSQLAWDPLICQRYPALSEAILSGATTQLRNMATAAGNIMQRTRCSYFRDVYSSCNKRDPGSGCSAINGINRGHAILGTSKSCIAMYPSDMCTALVIFDANVRIQKRDGSIRRIPLNDFHLLPGDTPNRETVLKHGELITHVDLPHSPFARNSHYLKVRDRASYEFALASAAVAIDLDGNTIRSARIALGGVATKPWRCFDAENELSGRAPTQESFNTTAELALAGANPQKGNKFKIELAKHTLITCLGEVVERIRSLPAERAIA